MDNIKKLYEIIHHHKKVLEQEGSYHFVREKCTKGLEE